MRVLVIDDNYDAASALAMLVELWGYDVEVGYSGFEALEARERFVPDVILLDIGLPGLSGYETARRIRADIHDARRDADVAAGQSDGRCRQVVQPLLIAVTGYGSTDDVAQAFRAGFDHHVLKPSDPQVLEELLGGHARLLASQAAETHGIGSHAPERGSLARQGSPAKEYRSEGVSAALRNGMI